MLLQCDISICVSFTELIWLKLKTESQSKPILAFRLVESLFYRFRIGFTFSSILIQLPRLREIEKSRSSLRGNGSYKICKHLRGDLIEYLFNERGEDATDAID